MSSDRRSHPTVRPHALALGVLPRSGVAARLSFLGPGIASDLAAAMMLDTLGVLSTFPVKHRFCFTEESTSAGSKLPATWKRFVVSGHAGDGEPSPARQALGHLFSLGGEAALLVVADTPVMPLGELFDGLLALAQPKAPPALLVGPIDSGGIFAIGLTRNDPELLDAISWEGPAAREGLDRAAAAAGLEVRATTPGYVVDSPEALKRLKGDVERGAFAPNCRKLLERPDVERAIAASGG
jgi:glycosyltransferase A (GT-A) superfamily protein (DUF2064 family)